MPRPASLVSQGSSLGLGSLQPTLAACEKSLTRFGGWEGVGMERKFLTQMIGTLIFFPSLVMSEIAVRISFLWLKLITQEKLTH